MSEQNPNIYQIQPNQSNGQLAPVMSIGEWLVTMLVMCIPFINVIMMLVWAFGSGNPNRANYFKAQLILAMISVAVIIVFALAFGSLFAAASAQ